MQSTDLDVLERLKQAYGGSLSSAICRPHRKEAWAWILQGKAAETLAVAVLPYMSSRRRQQISDAFGRVKSP